VTIFYQEIIDGKCNYYEIKHDDRAKFWVEHPHAKEISRKEYYAAMDSAKNYSMTILFLGNFSAEFSSENYYRKTLHDMGHHVIALQERVATAQDILSHKKIDAFVWVHTHGWDTPGMLDVLKEFCNQGIPTLGYHLDLYMPLERWKQYENSDYFKVQHFFTVDQLMSEWLNKNTATNGHYIPAGCYEGDCYLGKPDYQKYPHEIIFTGAKTYHPEYPYRGQLIEWLQKNYGSKFAHYGNGGGLPVVRGPELNNLYASAKIVIGDTLCKNFDYPYYFSDRLFEVPGRGGFMIFPYIKGLEWMYKIGEEIESYEYNNFQQLENKINHYLRAPVEREKIKLAGHNKVKAVHTYRKRWEYILENL